MCGIAGWVDFARDLGQEQQTLAAMGETLRRRGPDTGNSWVERHVALVHRRLIVVDPAGGAQPMEKTVGGQRFVLVYNGELYNTEEVRQQLLSKGHTFSSYSDTEVLLTAYIAWGEQCLHHFNGIFAFAIWDVSRQRLFLARDRLGVKPLFYAQPAGGLVFGSELKAVLANPLVPRVLDATGLAELLLIGPARTPGVGLFQGINDLRAGHYLVHDRSGTRVQRYWQLTSQPHADDLQTTVDRVRCLVEDSVRRQLISDVPVATFLSGGLDSSAITAIAAREFRVDGRGPLHTYSVDYRGNADDFQANDYLPDADAPWVQVMSEAVGTVHHRVIIDTPDLVPALLDSMRANDYPGMTDIDSSLLLFCRQIKQQHTVALSGEAADEVFGGYPWFRRDDALNAGTFPWALRNSERERILSPEVVRLIEPASYVADRYQQALQEVPRLPGEAGREARMREMFYLNITRFMPTLLDRKDRMSMASGLEVRVPFTDHRLVEYVWNIPWAMKYVDQREKGILRRALRGLLPDDVLYRRKSPYPKTHNPVYLQLTKQWLLDVLSDPTSPLLSLIDVPTVRQIAEHDGENFGPTWFGQLMGGAQLFAYLALIDAWLREYRISILL